MARDTTLRREPVLRASEPPLLAGTEAANRGAEPSLGHLLVTTTPSVEGRPVAAYLGVITGEATLELARLRGEAPRRGMLGFLRRQPPKAAGSLSEAREEALRDLTARAASRGADAVLGISFDAHGLDDLLMVSASGTAVRLG